MEKLFSRRDFFKLFGAITIASSLPLYSKPNNNRLGRLLLSTFSDKSYNGSNFQILIYDLDQQKMQIISTPSLQHSFEASPKNPSEIIAQTQWGNDLCIIDLNSNRIKKIIKTDSTEELFVGHGVYSPDGNLFYSSMASYESPEKNLGKGILNIYDLNSGKKTGVLNSGGFEPHGLVWVEKGKKLLILNPGVGPNHSDKQNKIIPSIIVLEISSGKIIKELNLEKQGIALGHLNENQKNNLLLIGGKKSGTSYWRPIAFRLEDNLNLVSLEIDAPETKNPLLSPLLDPIGKYAVASSPSYNKVYFWEFQTGKMIKQMEIFNPLGISLTLDQSHFVITSGHKISLVERKNLMITKTIPLGNFSPKGHCLIV